MIIGTAGHIDHGKTTLVKALTGVDTDRLKEEKARGISIELGYAYTPLAGGGVLGFIDVPGHERLVHTMVAGAGGIDLALLVIAADDGIMPQTREHLAILGLLGITRGVVALTKADRASLTRLEDVKHGITALLAPTSLAGSPIFAVNATQPLDLGIRALSEHLHALAACAERGVGPCVGPSRRGACTTRHAFRLGVDRVFSLPGHGTVVTGTVLAGTVECGGSLELMPQGRLARVRSLHAQNRPAAAGRAGERCALNLAGIDRGDVRRGDWLAAPGALRPSTRLDVRLSLLPQAPIRQLRPWAPLHIHLGTAHHVAHGVLLESGALHPGDSKLAQLVFDTPVCALPGERFIVRDAQAATTLGGGVVLDPAGPARRRRTPQRLAWLAALERLSEDGIAPLVAAAPQGVRLAELARLSGLSGLGGGAEALDLPPQARLLGAAPHHYVLHATAHERLRTQALAGLAAFHAAAPEEPGADLARLRRIAAPQLDEALWRTLMEELRLEERVRRSGPWWHLPHHTVSLTAADEALLTQLQPLIAAGGFDPPWVRELAAHAQEPEERVRTVLRKGVTQGRLYQVVRDLFYDPGRVAELAAILAQLARRQGPVSASQYRDALCLGRKRAIQILEFFDRVGLTRRVRDTHLLRPESGWGLKG